MLCAAFSIYHSTTANLSHTIISNDLEDFTGNINDDGTINLNWNHTYNTSASVTTSSSGTGTSLALNFDEDEIKSILQQDTLY